MSAPAAPSISDETAAGRRPWVVRTPFRTFVLYPVIVLGEQLVRRRGRIRFDGRFAPLLAWGCLQFRLVGDYRVERGGGGPGIQVPPDDLVETGAYQYTRNPMYLAQLIFLAGLALGFRSIVGAMILGANAAWFHQRVLEDEARLSAQFGARYEAYRARVKRWIPGLL
jgi:hypothetical protein